MMTDDQTYTCVACCFGRANNGLAERIGDDDRVDFLSLKHLQCSVQILSQINLIEVKQRSNRIELRSPYLTVLLCL
jgi:hypothetical protein